MSFDLLTASLTLSGSIISCLGSGCILVCFMIYRSTQRSFRHALVFNLAVSDFVNTLNNSISGSVYMATKGLVAGPACTLNGWVGQLSVQATDFSILAISIATFLVVTRHTELDSMSKTKRTLLCLSLWIMPLISSTTVAALGDMKPVSGNWCWISKDRPNFRYGFAHGWRFLIIFLVICIYVYVYVYLSQHFKTLHAVSQPTAGSAGWDHSRSRAEIVHPHCGHAGDQACGHPYGGMLGCAIPLSQAGALPEGVQLYAGTPKDAPYLDPVAYHPALRKPATISIHTTQRQTTQPSGPTNMLYTTTTTINNTQYTTTTTINNTQYTTTSSVAGTGARSAPSRSRGSVEAEIKRMLLLNGYPIMYILLWIPGLTNRIMEASGRPSSSKVLAALQCSTQFVGFANALTYGLNKEMRHILGHDLKRLFQWRRKRSSRLELGE